MKIPAHKIIAAEAQSVAPTNNLAVSSVPVATGRVALKDERASRFELPSRARWSPATLTQRGIANTANRLTGSTTAFGQGIPERNSKLPATKHVVTSINTPNASPPLRRHSIQNCACSVEPKPNGGGRSL